MRIFDRKFLRQHLDLLAWITCVALDPQTRGSDPVPPQADHFAQGRLHWPIDLIVKWLKAGRVAECTGQRLAAVVESTVINRFGNRNLRCAEQSGGDWAHQACRSAASGGIEAGVRRLASGGMIRCCCTTPTFNFEVLEELYCDIVALEVFTSQFVIAFS